MDGEVQDNTGSVIGPRNGMARDQVPDQAEPQDAEEWPPREWRETSRSAGHRQALFVGLAMIAIFAVLVAVNIWGSHQG